MEPPRKIQVGDRVRCKIGEVHTDMIVVSISWFGDECECHWTTMGYHGPDKHWVTLSRHLLERVP